MVCFRLCLFTVWNVISLQKNFLTLESGRHSIENNGTLVFIQKEVGVSIFSKLFRREFFHRVAILRFKLLLVLI